jgi:hypothetical protein
MDQLSPQDAQFLYLESADNLTHLTSIAIFDQSTVPGGEVVRFKDILAHVEGRLHMSPFRTGSTTSISISSTTSVTGGCLNPATGASSAFTWRATTRGRWT